MVAGNVETSQCITDALYGAMGVMAAAQGTMNNFTFGNDRHQYYETISGGSGAGPDFDGTDAVQTHMTNSRLTDPEVLEFRFPVLLEDFHIRRGQRRQGQYQGRRRCRAPGPVPGTDDRRRCCPATAGRTLRPEGRPAEGALGKNSVDRRNGGGIVELKGTDGTEMSPGDVFLVETPGGGGYGRAQAVDTTTLPEASGL